MKIEIVFSDKFYKKINWLVENYPIEVAGYMVGEWNETGVYVEDLLIFNQEVSKSNISKTGQSEALLVAEYGVEKTNRIIGEWHSHNTMSTFWSSTDEDFIKTFLNNENGQKIRNACLSVVSAYHEYKKEKYDHKVRVDINGIMGLSGTIDDLEYYVEESRNEKIEEINGKKKKLMSEAQEKINPLKEQIEKILKEAEEKANEIKKEIENIEDEENEEISEFLGNELKNKVKENKPNYSNYPKSFRPEEKTDYQSQLNNIKSLEQERNDIKNKYFRFKGKKKIFIEGIYEDWAETLVMKKNQEQYFENVKLNRKLNSTGTYNLIFENFFGKKQFKKLRDEMINLVMELRDDDLLESEIEQAVNEAEEFETTKDVQNYYDKTFGEY